LALLSAVKEGTVTAAEALPRLSRAPYWGWVALDPVTPRSLTMDVGDRPLAMAPRVVPQVAPVGAPACAPLCLPDGVRASMTVWLTHDGRWVKPPRPWAPGAAPTPRWIPRPQVL
jgi:hypothetical protein